MEKEKNNESRLNRKGKGPEKEPSPKQQGRGTTEQEFAPKQQVKGTGQGSPPKQERKRNRKGKGAENESAPQQTRMNSSTVATAM